jgi:anti-sigma factor RsiW
MMNRKTLGLLVRSFDGELAPGEREELNAALAQSDELRAERDRLAALEVSIRRGAIRSFGPEFENRVMRRIASIESRASRRKNFYESLVAVARPALAGFLILCLGLVTFNLLKGGNLSISSLFVFNDITFEDVFIPTFSPFI